jgi:hypothetical protein
MNFADECGGIDSETFLVETTETVTIHSPEVILEFPKEKCRIFRGYLNMQEVVAGVMVNDDLDTNKKTMISVGDARVKKVELIFEDFASIRDSRVVEGTSRDGELFIMGILFDLGDGRYSAAIEYSQVTGFYAGMSDELIMVRMDQISW